MATAIALLSLVAAVAGCSSAPGPSAPATGHSTPGQPAVRSAWNWGDQAGQPAQFSSLRFAPRGLQTPGPAGFLEVAVSNSRTGAIISRLMPASRDGMRVVGLALDRSGNLWITYSAGPVGHGNLAGGSPQPHSCANEIVIDRGVTGRLQTILRTGDNVLISGAVPSPDGKLLAYSESGCSTGYFNSHLRVTNLSTGRSWTIGAGLPRCHFITDPSWSTDGRTLIVAYAPAAVRAYSGPQGTCIAPRTERLVEVAATEAQAGLTGSSAAADRGCQITSAAGVAGGGAAAVEDCGGRQARLLVLDASLRRVSQFALGRCTDGNEVRPDLPGRSVLISAYLYCNPPGTPGPVTRLWSYDGRTLRPIIAIPGDTDGVSLMAW